MRADRPASLAVGTDLQEEVIAMSVLKLQGLTPIKTGRRGAVISCTSSGNTCCSVQKPQ